MRWWCDVANGMGMQPGRTCTVITVCKNCFEVGSDLWVRNWKLVLSQNHFKIGSKLGVRNRNVVQKVWHGKKR
jgi:hypothetical protein